MSALDIAPSEASYATAQLHPNLSHLSAADIDAIGARLDAVREREFADRGERDARYILRVLRLQQAFEVTGRLAFFGMLWWTPAWVVGVVLLTLSKILDNMELGHNIMHGQYDFMNDPRFDSQTYEWDHTSSSDGWRNSHNVLHHTYTNVLDVDRDIGYGMLRISPEQEHGRRHRWQPLSALMLAVFFDVGIALHDLEMSRLFSRRDKLDDSVRDMARVSAVKAGRLALKDFVIFPLLAFPVFVPVLLGNLATYLLRNLWEFAVIFCGHFPAGVAMFDEEVLEGESRHEWYLRQMLGSANIEGGRMFSLWAGNLNHQIEHHLFPDMPSHRLAAVAVEVRAICEEYDLMYVTGRFSKQFGNVVGRIIKYSLPNEKLQRLGMRLV